jgi:hypothetical protein
MADQVEVSEEASQNPLREIVQPFVDAALAPPALHESRKE